jgi:hypothetical protein
LTDDDANESLEEEDEEHDNTNHDEDDDEDEEASIKVQRYLSIFQRKKTQIMMKMMLRMKRQASKCKDTFPFSKGRNHILE